MTFTEYENDEVDIEDLILEPPINDTWDRQTGEPVRNFGHQTSREVKSDLRQHWQREVVAVYVHDKSDNRLKRVDGIDHINAGELLQNINRSRQSAAGYLERVSHHDFKRSDIDFYVIELEREGKERT